MSSELASVAVGARIWFAEEVRPYRVRARGARYMVCTKPFNPRRTVLYTVVDLQDGVRGTENLIFGLGAETDQECQDMCDRLHGADPLWDGERSEVSRRNRIPLRVRKVSA